MTKIFVIFCMLFMYLPYTKAQDSDFNLLLNSDGDEKPWDFILDQDENFLGIIHRAHPPTHPNPTCQSYLYKISLDGDTSSIKFVKEDTMLLYYHLIRLNSEPEGFLMHGWGAKEGEDFGYNAFNVFVRLNNELEVIWEKIYRFEGYYYTAFTAEIMELKTGDILYASAPMGGTEMLLMSLSPQGDSLGFREYVGDSAGYIIGLSYNYDSTDVFLSSYFAHYVSGSRVSSVIHIDVDDHFRQTHVDYYPEGLRMPYNALSFPGNRWLTGGSYDYIIYPQMIHEQQIGAYLLDSNFNVQHQILLTDPDTNSRGGEITSIDYYDPSCIYLGGTHNVQGTYGNEPTWFYVARLNDTLGLEYEKYIGGEEYDWFCSVKAAPDGGVLITGTLKNFPNDTLVQRDVLIIKFDSTGFPVSVPEESDIRITDAILYPNPGGDYLKVRTALKNCRLNLHDINGREVLSAPLTDHITSVSTASLPAGSYPYMVVQNKKEIISGVWIKK